MRAYLGLMQVQLPSPMLRSKSVRHRGRWIAAGILLSLALLLIAARLALTPFVAHLTRQQLNARPHMSGDFSDLSLSVLTLGYHLQALELHMHPAGGTPITASVENIDAHLLWRELLRFHIVAEARADNIKALAIIETPEEAAEMLRQLQHVASMHGLGAQLEAQPPFRASRIELRNLDVTLADHTEKGVSRKSAEIWVHGIDATLENLADRAPLLGGRPTTLALKGEVQRSGAATLFATVDPLADQLDLALELTLKHLDLRELYGFIAAKTKLQAEGDLDAFATLKVRAGQLEGAVKPVIANLKVRPADANAGPELEAWVANAAVGMGTDRVPGRNGLASVIPISGPVTDPKVDLWSSFVILLHNAYQEALPRDQSHLPPAAPGAKPAQGKVGQVAGALTKKQFPAVQASGQPKGGGT